MFTYMVQFPNDCEGLTRQGIVHLGHFCNLSSGRNREASFSKRKKLLLYYITPSDLHDSLYQPRQKGGAEIFLGL